MAEHSSLTGASLHEPKGVAAAASGKVYVSDGAGSGVWTNRFDTVYNYNKYTIQGLIPDVSTSGSSFFASVPFKSTFGKFFGVLSGAVITADSVLTIYKNGVAQTPTLTIPFAASGAGVETTIVVTPVLTFNEGDRIEVRTNGGSDNAVSLTCTLVLTAVP